MPFSRLSTAMLWRIHYSNNSKTNERAVGAGQKLEESDWSVVGKWAGCRRHSDSEMNTEINVKDVSLHSVMEDRSPPSSLP